MTMFIKKPLERTAQLWEPSDNGLSDEQFAALAPAEQAKYDPSPRDFTAHLKWMALKQTRAKVAAMSDPLNPQAPVLPGGVAAETPNFYSELGIKYSTLEHRIQKARFPSEEARADADDAHFQMTHDVTDYQDAFYRTVGKIEAGVIARSLDVNVEAEYTPTPPRVNPAALVGQPMVFVKNNIGQLTDFRQWGIGTQGHQVAFGSFHHGVITGCVLTFEGLHSAGTIEIEIRYQRPGEAEQTLGGIVYSGENNAQAGGTADMSTRDAALWEFKRAGPLPFIRYTPLTRFKVYSRDVGFNLTGAEGQLTLFYRDTPPPHLTA